MTEAHSDADEWCELVDELNEVRRLDADNEALTVVGYARELVDPLDVTILHQLSHRYVVAKRRYKLQLRLVSVESKDRERTRPRYWFVATGH